MEIKLIRKTFTKNSTIGDLFINDAYFCHTLEDKYRADGTKIKGETAIPEGEYNIIIDWSNRFSKWMPHILEVPGFDGIRIHKGNTKDDTEGCILVGADISKDRIFNCTAVFNNLIYQIEESMKRKEPVVIIITKEVVMPAEALPREVSWWERLHTIADFILPVVAPFIPGGPIVQVALKGLPKIIDLAEDISDDGNVKKEIAMGAFGALAKAGAAASTGGQKETFERLQQIADPLTDVIIASEKTWEDPTIDTVAYAIGAAKTALEETAKKFEWQDYVAQG